MFTQTNIVEKLNFYDINCDIYEVEAIIKELCLEPIFEDNKGQLYYDDEAYEMVKTKLEETQPSVDAKTAEVVLEDKDMEQTSLTVDNSSKSLAVIAKSISEQITADLAKYIKKNHSTEEAFKAGVFKRDNEILSKKLQDTINDNKKLIEKIRQMEYELHKYHPVFGNIYVKRK